MTAAATVPFDAVAITLDQKNLVEASAGTGKTYAITTLFVRLLLESQLDPSEILVVTFTEAATAELRDRVRGRIVEAEAAFGAALAGEAPKDEAFARLAKRRGSALADDLKRLRRAVENIDEAPISTIHGFCQRVLHDNAFGTRVPFGAQLIPDLSELYDDVLYDLWQCRVAHGSPGFARQAAALGVDMPRLRRLLEEARRNPRVAVVPVALAPVEAEALERALAEVRRELARFDGFAYVGEHCKASDFGKGDALHRLLHELRGCVACDEPNELYFPPGAEKLFPTEVAARLYQKFAGDPGAAHPFFAAFERLVRLSWLRVIALQHEVLRELPKELERRKTQRGVLGFEDLLLRVADALAGEDGPRLEEALRQRFRAVLIDEFQDTDPVQFEIFERVFGGGSHPLFLIGDPKQAIYAFRGADVFAYLAAAENARRFSMGTSYRSDPGHVAVVNQLFRLPGTFVIPAIGYSDVAPKPGATNAFHAAHASGSASVELLFVRRTHDGKPLNKSLARRAAARIVAADIVRLLQGPSTIARAGGAEPVGAGDVAVLTRTNAQCFLVQDALRARGIVSVVISDTSVFESEEAADVQAVLGAVLDPMSRSDLRRAVATSLLGVTGDQIAAHEADAEWWQSWLTRFRKWHDLWVERGFVRMFRALLTDTGAAANLLALAGGERRLTNALHLSELLHRAATEQHLGPAALLAWLADQRAGEVAVAERAEIRLESDEAAVKILTVHKAKGLEFPVVYCPFLWDAGGGKKNGGPFRFHDRAGRATLDIDVDPPARADNWEWSRWESFAEEMRVAYVALTRAQHRTTIVWGGFNQIGESAAAFLLHPPGVLTPPAVPSAARLNQASDADLERDLQQLVARGQPALAVRTVPLGDDQAPMQPAAQAGEPLQPRPIPNRIHSWQRTSSFSNLIQRELGWQLDEEEGRDRDQEVSAAAAAEIASAPAAPAERVRITLDGFPRGRRTGDLFHDVFEQLDFASATEHEIAAVSQAKLDGFGFTPGFSVDELEVRRAQMVRAIRETLETPLFAGGPRLADIGARNKFAELEFRMPVGEGDLGLTRCRLAEVFRAHPSDRPGGALPPAYADRVERLGFRELRGFLKGYIDLVFEHGGLWYVVDYKTNHLGDHRDDYGPSAMRQELEESHYFLQYHLYALALDRYLAHWQKGYAYDQHFGGVLYLFVKGMHPSAPVGNGVFFEKPPLARMRALGAVLDGAGGRE
ncbi:MAG: exodeoxyribonuclease V subunit beta [Polyangiaceae bacterium]|nr:exodeoxyribonuclease V subunit beta [Polyangiaceae bacterium]